VFAHPETPDPKGLLLALVVTVVMTATPLVIAVGANAPSWKLWGEGWWSTIAYANGGEGFAYAVVASSLIGTFGMHCVRCVVVNSWFCADVHLGSLVLCVPYLTYVLGTLLFKLFLVL
jgi:hypothetical protein